MAFVISKRSYSPLPEIGTWITMADVALDDQDKSLDYDIDIKFGSVAFVHAVFIEYISSAAEGNPKPIRLNIRDSSGVRIRQLDFLKDAADGVAVTTIFECAHGLTPPSSPRIEHETLPEKWVILPGQDMRIQAISGVTAGDDMKVSVLLQVL